MTPEWKKLREWVAENFVRNANYAPVVNTQKLLAKMDEIEAEACASRAFKELADDTKKQCAIVLSEEKVREIVREEIGKAQPQMRNPWGNVWLDNKDIRIIPGDK